MFPDGNQDIGNVRQGKRCFINKLIFGVSDPSQQLVNPSPTALAAGDSNDDVVFLGDATGHRLVINRNRTEIMCHAYANANDKWLINPQFIEPKGQRTELYACSPFSLPDQEDTVFCVNRVYESQNCNGELR